jgi:nitrogen-specific signal transduction histidine kinase/CheY-like chemotaxis protein
MALDTVFHAVERHSIETERTRLEARLQQARRMEKIGIFTSGIAHNFNNILGGILGHSEVMEERLGSDAKLVRNLGAIRQGAERARDLIDQILGFGRRRDTHRKPLSVGALIAETASLLDASLPPSVDLVIRQPPVPMIISGENAQLQQVILNLCNNAVQAMPDSGRVEVTTESREVLESRPLSHDELKPGQYACIAVTDTGRGMDTATMARIFEPFFTTRESGNGLGLATAREIVREHGGAMDVQSKVGEGSRFEIWLPRPTTAQPISEPSAAALPIGKGETILILAQDSERVLRDEEVLAALGYEPVGFTTADAALASCRANPNRFDIVMVCHRGSTALSLEVAAGLHSAVPRLPILFATDGAIEIDADTLVAAGISDVVRWPIAMALAHSRAKTSLETLTSRPRALATSG